MYLLPTSFLLLLTHSTPSTSIRGGPSTDIYTYCYSTLHPDGTTTYSHFPKNEQSVFQSTCTPTQHEEADRYKDDEWRYWTPEKIAGIALTDEMLACWSEVDEAIDSIGTPAAEVDRGYLGLVLMFMEPRRDGVREKGPQEVLVSKSTRVVDDRISMVRYGPKIEECEDSSGLAEATGWMWADVDFEVAERACRGEIGRLAMLRTCLLGLGYMGPIS